MLGLFISKYTIHEKNVQQQLTKTPSQLLCVFLFYMLLFSSARQFFKLFSHILSVSIISHNAKHLVSYLQYDTHIGVKKINIR